MLSARPQRRSADDIVIGASLPLSGPLAGFGSFQQWGYKRAVDEVNKAGGIAIDGNKRQVKLVIRDDKTDPNATASNTETLISRDHVVAMLGSCTPALVNAGALVAERAKKPIVTGCDPLEAFKSVRKWNYVWDLFFHEPELAAAQFKALADLGAQDQQEARHLARQRSRRTGGRRPDLAGARQGIRLRGRPERLVPDRQFAIHLDHRPKPRARAPTSCSSTRSRRRRSRSASRWPRPATRRRCSTSRRARSPSNSPKRSASSPTAFWSAAIGIPTFPYPGAADLAKAFESETKLSSSQHIADSYAAAQVLLDAIAAAGSTDPEKINAAIAKTDKTYVVGPIKFDENHTSKLPIVALQWQGGKTVIIWPKASATGSFLFPMP